MPPRGPARLTRSHSIRSERESPQRDGELWKIRDEELSYCGNPLLAVRGNALGDTRSVFYALSAGSFRYIASDKAAIARPRARPRLLGVNNSLQWLHEQAASRP